MQLFAFTLVIVVIQKKIGIMHSALCFSGVGKVGLKYFIHLSVCVDKKLNCVL